MRRLLLASILLASAIVLPVPTMAGVEINIGIPLPPLIPFPAPPEVIVVPDTVGVYVVPDVDVDIFFWNGWWWRPWEGRWYRSRYYDRGWGYYRDVPRFYYDVDPEWRGYYGRHDWHGHRWNYERIPNQRLQRNWKTWERDRHWERRGTWGVQNYQPAPQRQRQELRRQREEHYRQRPDVQRVQQERRDRQRAPGVQRPEGRGEGAPRAGQPPREQHRPQVQQPPREQRQPQVHQSPREQRQPQGQHLQREQQPRQEQSQPRGRQPQGDPDRQRGQDGREGGGGGRGR